MKLLEISARFYDSIDIDECAISAHNCHGVAYCFNIPGSFSCECRKSYIGDGISCEPFGKNDVKEYLADNLLLPSVFVCEPLYTRHYIKRHDFISTLKIYRYFILLTLT